MELLSLTAYMLLVGVTRALTDPDFALHKFGPPRVRAHDRVGFQFGRLEKRADVTSYNITVGTFQQLIDHSNPSLGTFSQRFWWNADHYGGVGSPIVFSTPGEESGEYDLGCATNLSIMGLIAQTIGAAAIVFEHRYFGESSPFTDLTAANLTYLTLENAIKDTTYFAKHVQLPFDPDGTSTPDKAPWLFSGASYAGMLSAFTNVMDPGIFWAHHASSAPVQAITDFWQWFTPVQEGMPKNCSTDVTLVTEYMDKVLTTGSHAEKEALKAKFGFAGLAHSDDFVAALWNIPEYWQIHSVKFTQWCDYVENVWPNSGNKTPGVEGVGLEKALEGYAKYSREVYTVGRESMLSLASLTFSQADDGTQGCQAWADWYNFPDWNETGNVQCFDTYNTSTPHYTDRSNRLDRGWNWMLCDWPLESWQDGAPEGHPTIVSRLIDVKYWRRQCELWFGPKVGVATGKKADDVNKVMGGWFINTTRLVWVDGHFDGWRQAGVSSDFRPGGPRASTNETPVFVIPSGRHNDDIDTWRRDDNEDVKKAQDNVIAVLKGWVEDFYKEKGICRDLETDQPCKG